MIITLILLALLIGGYFLFRNTLNRLQYIGPVFWITRDNGAKGVPFFTIKSFMLGTSPPWKISDHSVQFRVGRHTFQAGTCHDAPIDDPSDEIAGLEYILSYHDEA